MVREKRVVASVGMVPLLVLLFIVVPIVELWVILQVGEIIGVAWTLVLLILDSLFGSLLLRSQGRATWRRFNLALSNRRVPAREVIDGALVIVGGTLLLTPGFVTDIFGLLLLLPPSRAVARGLLARRFKFPTPGNVRGRATRSYDVDGSAVEVEPEDPPALPR